MSRDDQKLEPLLSLPDLAKAFGWKQGRLYRLCEMKKIPHLRVNGPNGRIYFELSAVEAWKEAQRVPVAGERDRRAITPNSQKRTRAEECALLGIPVDHEFA
jgi:hypothetical protein